MKRKVRKINGKRVVELIPESEADVEELRQRPDVDDRHSFADDTDQLVDVDRVPEDERELGGFNVDE